MAFTKAEKDTTKIVRASHDGNNSSNSVSPLPGVFKKRAVTKTRDNSFKRGLKLNDAEEDDLSPIMTANKNRNLIKSSNISPEIIKKKTL